MPCCQQPLLAVFIFSHPVASYFSVGKIGADQLAEYAQRKNLPLAVMQRWLAPIFPSMIQSQDEFRNQICIFRKVSKSVLNIFPPKSLVGIQKLSEMTAALMTVSPEYFSVTFGAGGSDCHGTEETVALLQKCVRVPVVPHFTASGLIRSDLQVLLEKYKEMGIKKLVVLRGDKQVYSDAATTEFLHGCDLVKFVREIVGENFHIVVGAYPEGHPESQTADENVMSFEK